MNDVASIYREHGHHVLRRARRILGSDAEAEEALHEVFTEIVARPEQLARASSLVAWLYGATTHLCLNRLRNQKNRGRLLATFAPADEAVSAGAEEAAILRQLLAQLPDELAAVAVYYFADGMTHEEISQLLGCSRRHVGNLLERLDQRVNGGAPLSTREVTA